MTNQTALPEVGERGLPRAVFRLVWPVVLQEAAWTILSMIIMVFMVVSVRQHAPMIPIAVYRQFFDTVLPLYPARKD